LLLPADHVIVAVTAEQNAFKRLAHCALPVTCAWEHQQGAPPLQVLLCLSLLLQAAELPITKLQGPKIRWLLFLTDAAA
jgi:hypothetical protein